MKTPQAHAAVWRPAFRRGVRALLARLPDGTADFVYRQIKGAVRDVGRWGPEERVALRGGGEMLLDLADSQQRHLYYCGFYERRYIACLSRFLDAGGTFIDVGANVGFYTLWAARHVGPKGRVVSFEPNPQAFRHLATNVSVNGLTNVTLFNTAVGERESMACLTANPSDTATSYLVAGAEADDAAGIAVSVRSLDACLKTAGVDDVSLIKIDAEGSEPAIFRGAERTVARRPHLLVEVDAMRLKRAGSSEQALLGILAALGYAPYEVAMHGELRRFEPTSKRRRHVNLFFVPHD